MTVASRSEEAEEERERFIAALSTDYAKAQLDDADRAMLDYAARLTLAPGEIAERDVGLLRERGFDDRAIHDICAIAAYFAFVNRIADGLGVEVEEGWE